MLQQQRRRAHVAPRDRVTRAERFFTAQAQAASPSRTYVQPAATAAVQARAAPGGAMCARAAPPFVQAHSAPSAAVGDTVTGAPQAGACSARGRAMRAKHSVAVQAHPAPPSQPASLSPASAAVFAPAPLHGARTRGLCASPQACDEATLGIPAELGWIVSHERHHIAIAVNGSSRIKPRKRRKAEKTSVFINGRKLTNACDVTVDSPTWVERLTEGAVVCRRCKNRAAFLARAAQQLDHAACQPSVRAARDAVIAIAARAQGRTH